MTRTHTSADIHQEKVFEAHIVASLTTDQGYVERDCAAHYDVAHALDTGLLFRFLKTTQPEAWRTLEDHYSAQAEAEVLKRLDKALKDAPTHMVLREGIKLVPNIRFALCFFKPASNLNPDLTRLYEANILSVTHASLSVIVLSFVIVGFNTLRLRRSTVAATAARRATPKGSARGRPLHHPVGHHHTRSLGNKTRRFRTADSQAVVLKHVYYLVI